MLVWLPQLIGEINKKVLAAFDELPFIQSINSMSTQERSEMKNTTPSGCDQLLSNFETRKFPFKW